MIANLKLLALIFVAALAVNAASSSSTNTSTAPVPSSTAAIPACVANCLGNATSSAPGGCTSPTNVTCVCTSTEFQEAAQKCLKANCSAADQATANALGQSQCPNTTSTSSTLTSATSPASATTSKGAGMVKAQLGYGEMVGAVVALFGVVVGSGLVF